MTDEKFPETLDELCDYITTHAGTIYVREQHNGRWGSFSLSELPGKVAIAHALRFIKEGRVPVRVREEIHN